MVGDRLRISRVALGKSQAELARAVGITPQRWNNYEMGRRPLDIDIAMAICGRTLLTLDWLYRGEMGALPFDIAQRIQPHWRPENGQPN